MCLKNLASLLTLPSVLNHQVDLIYVDNGENPVGVYLPPQFNFPIGHIRTCNGLVCVTCVTDLYANVMYLCNPSTKRFKILPTPSINTDRMRLVIGFWFDFVSNDYKIIRIVIYSDDLAAEVYSENSNAWKEIKVPNTVQRFHPCLHSECVHIKTGMLNFNGNGGLLSFNPHNEVFGLCEFPKSVGSEKKSNALDFEGSVAMIFAGGGGSIYSLWTLDDVCGKVSWNKKFNLEIDLRMDRVALYLGFGQYVVVINHIDGSDIYYGHDFKKKEPYFAPLGDGELFVKYSESLVSLKGFSQED